MTDPDPAPSAPPAPPPPAPRPKRELLGVTGLIVMVGAILLFTAASILIEVAVNRNKGPYGVRIDVVGQIREDAVRVVFHVKNSGSRAGHPDKCDATLLDAKGERVGTASVSVEQDIPPGETLDLLGVGTVAARPVSGVGRCRSLEPG